jgi:hypothetical protein
VLFSFLSWFVKLSFNVCQIRPCVISAGQMPFVNDTIIRFNFSSFVGVSSLFNFPIRFVTFVVLTLRYSKMACPVSLGVPCCNASSFQIDSIQAIPGVMNIQEVIRMSKRVPVVSRPPCTGRFTLLQDTTSKPSSWTKAL